MRACYVFDIDGTLADCEHRLHHIQKETKDWAAFFAGCGEDKPIEHICRLARDLADCAPIVLVTGRSDECEHETSTWLQMTSVPCAALYMRKKGDHRNDDIVKSELMDRAIADGWSPMLVFEDRKRVVDAWRARGIPCAQVADGDF